MWGGWGEWGEVFERTVCKLSLTLVVATFVRCGAEVDASSVNIRVNILMLTGSSLKVS